MTTPQWSADIHVDAALAARLVAAQFPELDTSGCKPFGMGWDNAAFLIDGIVFRFPRRRICAALIEREVALLPAIAMRLPIAISAPSFIGAATPEYPYVFAGYERITGVTACSLPLTGDARTSLAVPLAHFLRALHELDLAPLVARGLPSDEMGRLDGGKRVRMTRERLQALPATAIAGSGAFVAWLEAHPPVAPATDARRVVHGDLYARHLLLDTNARLTGVIDWGDIHLGDPAIDIAIALLVLPTPAHTAFRDAYGPIDDRTWTAARYRAIYHAIVEVDYGLRADDPGMREIGMTALRFLSDLP